MLSSTLSRRFTLTCAFIVVCVWTGSGIAADSGIAEGDSDFEVVDHSAIYYGEGSHPSAPAVIVADRVWAEIPEYKRIIDEELTDDDPAYHLLLKKATRRFKRALKKAARRDGYDMIGEIGSIKPSADTKKTVPDITADLIDLVSRD